MDSVTQGLFIHVLGMCMLGVDGQGSGWLLCVLVALSIHNLRIYPPPFLLAIQDPSFSELSTEG